MRKILFCIHKNSPFYLVIPGALKKLGYSVDIFDYYQSTITIRFLGLLNKISSFDKRRYFINQQINLSLLNKVNKFEPDILLVIKGLHITNQTIENIKKRRIITINWFQDLLEFMPWLINHASVYDYLFTPDALMQRELAKIRINAYYLPLAAAPDSKYKNHPKKYGIVFSGQYTKRREKLFSKLTSLGNDFVIWGYPGWKKSSLAKHYQGLLPSIEAMLQKFRESKIVINVQTAEDKYPSEVVSLRAFEATGVGTFLLNWRHKGIDDFWKEEKEIVNFKTANQVLEKAKYFLSHDIEREKIALAGWNRTKKDHTFTHRLRSMFKVVSSTKQILYHHQ